ncbi:hypothetical protein [Natronococcus jeotgali]|uniref:DUF308 domain-containing protein n=1 Tax=Natronococcus jeotgali DSM 18795 TaxID=1227498 RepID=L9XVG2_9EURY|nr:hypothetical protein [Natronococcus jeotgali]ELY65760.1 hypothetical protein C492_02739 [Natronococcus jeotgali DSM 18795]
MSDRKDRLRRGFLGVGVVTLVLAVGIVVLAGTTPVTAALFGWLAVGGGLLIVAGVRERLGSVGWPRIGAVGLAVLALGATTLGFTQLLAGAGGWTLLNGLVMLVVGLALVLLALECWLGGVGISAETFAVE